MKKTSEILWAMWNILECEKNKELASILGIPCQNISGYLCGKHDMNIETLEKAVNKAGYELILHKIGDTESVDLAKYVNKEQEANDYKAKFEIACAELGYLSKQMHMMEYRFADKDEDTWKEEISAEVMAKYGSRKHR